MVSATVKYPCPYRLLAIDVDGTLVTPEKRLLPEVRLAVRHAVDCGLAVSLVTGRMFPAVAAWVKELGLRSPQVCNNGADIVDPASGTFLQNLCLDPCLVPFVLRTGEELEVTTAVFTGSRVLVLRRTRDHWLIERNNEHVDVVEFAAAAAPDLRVEKLLFLDQSEPARMPILAAELARRVQVAALPPCSLEITEPGILNICHPRANKGLALQRLADLCGVSLAEVAAIGDSDNDAAMVAMAGLGIAMGNATPATRQAARIQVADNRCAGVVPAILDHVLGRAGTQGNGGLAAKLREARLAVQRGRAALVLLDGAPGMIPVMRLAAEELGDRVVAVAVASPGNGTASTVAADLARQFGVAVAVVDGGASLPVTLAELAVRHAAVVLDGRTADVPVGTAFPDGPSRGREIRSPLAEAGITRTEALSL